MDSLGHDPFRTDGEYDDTGMPGRARDSLFLMARLWFEGDATPRDVRVRNLSSGGLMAEIDRIVATGTAVALEVRGIGEVDGRVAWCTAGRIGIAFDGTIDPKMARKPVGTGAGTPDYAKPFDR